MLSCLPSPGRSRPCGNGSAYLYWGQFYLKGCKLKDNMRELEPDTIRTMLLTEEV